MHDFLDGAVFTRKSNELVVLSNQLVVVFKEAPNKAYTHITLEKLHGTAAGDTAIVVAVTVDVSITAVLTRPVTMLLQLELVLAIYEATKWSTL